MFLFNSSHIFCCFPGLTLVSSATIQPVMLPNTKFVEQKLESAPAIADRATPEESTEIPAGRWFLSWCRSESTVCTKGGSTGLGSSLTGTATAISSCRMRQKGR